MNQVIKTISIIVFLCPLLLLAANEAPPVSQTSPSTLIKLLKQGGYIIYMRHGPTDHGSKDTDRSNLKDCSRQRNLSPAGKQSMAKIGQFIKQLKIPIGKVSSSPYCRARDTAQLVFGKYQIDPNLQFSISKDKQESQKLGDYLKNAMLSSQPGNKNRVFVGHTSNLKDGTGIWPKPEGVIVVFKQNQNGLSYKGMIKPDDWIRQ